MEIIFGLAIILIFVAFVFFIIEYPYYLVSIFVFLHIYNFNLELPGPLDLRGMISVLLVFRLVLFDRDNLKVIINSLSNKYFILIIALSFYIIVIDVFNGIRITKTIKPMILNFSSLLIGFVTIINGYGKRTIILAICLTGVMAAADLVYSRSTLDILRVRRILVMIVKGGEKNTLGHNFFAVLCGYSFIMTLSLLLVKHINKLVGISLLSICMFGILISTSRMTFLTVTITSVLVLITQYKLDINFRKIISISLFSIGFIVIIGLSYSYIFSAMNLDTELADKIYYRIIEEPLSLLSEDVVNYSESGNIKHSTVQWRMNKTWRDLNVIFEQDIENLVFGFGKGGYSNIGATEFRGFTQHKFAAHNFYTDTLAEIGLIGLFIILSIIVLLTVNSIKLIKMGHLPYTLGYVLLYMLVNSIGANVSLTDEFGYLLFGSVIADVIQVVEVEYSQEEATVLVPENSM